MALTSSLPPTLTRTRPGTAGTRPGVHRAHAGSRRGSLQSFQSSSSSSPSTSKSTPAYEPRSTYAVSSYQTLVRDACQAIVTALNDNYTRIDVDFPALNNSDGYTGGSDNYIDNNAQYALATARLLEDARGLKTHVVLPDLTEMARAEKMLKSALELTSGASLGCLEKGYWLNTAMLSLSGGGKMDRLVEEEEAAAKRADVFIITNVTAVELPAVRKYVEEVCGDRPVILYNTELDTLRADLGLGPFFPPKSMHYEFLTQFLTVFYIRPRDYSKSTSVAPFLVNYSGAIFREYPGPWQAMIKQDNGELACVAERPERYALQELKEALLEVMGLNTEEAGSTMAFLRRGYKRMTWWEEGSDEEASGVWRT